jgi:glucose-6-phosphate 1-dehydrogenase
MTRRTGVSAERLPGAPIEDAATASPCAIVIFGATGDLTRRKLVPSLYGLAADGLLPDRFAVVGVGRRDESADAFRAGLRQGVEAYSRSKPIRDDVWSDFARRLSYVRGDHAIPSTYAALHKHLDAVDQRHGTAGNRVFYMAVPASSFPTILTQLRDADLIYSPDEPRMSRVVIEKPFGRDLASARQLHDLIGGVLAESQTFRIDHYLGKETVQNILVLRFANSIFEPLWNRRYVDHVQITAGESIGVEGRGAFYDETGALRDMVQSHLLQILALVAMEPPVSFAADDIRDQKSAVFRSLRPLAPDAVATAVVRAQFRGYLDAPNVAPDSRTPTYVALKVMLDSWRWSGVPFYVRTGKALAARLTEVAIAFKSIPLRMFDTRERCQRIEPSLLTLRLQPNEGIALRFASKVPGGDLSLASVNMHFDYAEAFDCQPQEAYERLLLDTMRGDATLFWRRDGVEQAWAFIEPIQRAWETDTGSPLPLYEPGSDGPEEADVLLRRDRRHWRALQ